MSSVISINGEEIVDPRVVCEDVVAEARRLLSLAEAGELRSFAGAAVSFDGATHAFAGGCSSGALIGRLEEVKIRMIKDWI